MSAIINIEMCGLQSYVADCHAVFLPMLIHYQAGSVWFKLI